MVLAERLTSIDAVIPHTIMYTFMYIKVWELNQLKVRVKIM